MKIIVNTKNDCAISVDFHCKTSESLILRSAIACYAQDLANHPDNRRLAQAMADTKIEFKEIDETERKKHEWLVYHDEDCPQDGIFKCPICGQIISVDTPIPLNFCPNCGTDMRGEEDE